MSMLNKPTRQADTNTPTPPITTTITTTTRITQAPNMVTFSILALAAASVLPMASAEACKTGLNYCGYTLRQIGAPPPPLCAKTWGLTQLNNSRRLLCRNRC